MFRKLRAGSFNPDANRVSRLFELTHDLAVQQDIDEASQGSETSSDSDVASSQSEKEVEMEQQVQPRLRSADVSAQSCRIHKISHVIHLLAEGGHRFECGRQVSSNHREPTASDVNNAEAVVCADCSRSHRSR